MFSYTFNVLFNAGSFPLCLTLKMKYEVNLYRSAFRDAFEAAQTCVRRFVACNVFREPPAAPPLLKGLLPPACCCCANPDTAGFPGAFGGVIPNGICGKSAPPTSSIHVRLQVKSRGTVY